MCENYTSSLGKPHKSNAEQKTDTKKTYCVSLLRERTVTGKTQLWGKKSRQQVPLGSNDRRGHSETPSWGGGAAAATEGTSEGRQNSEEGRTRDTGRRNSAFQISYLSGHRDAVRTLPGLITKLSLFVLMTTSQGVP